MIFFISLLHLTLSSKQTPIYPKYFCQVACHLRKVSKEIESLYWPSKGWPKSPPWPKSPRFTVEETFCMHFLNISVIKIQSWIIGIQMWTEFGFIRHNVTYTWSGLFRLCTRVNNKLAFYFSVVSCFTMCLKFLRFTHFFL